MSKFSRLPTSATTTSPVGTTGKAGAVTHEGGDAHYRKPKAELFLLAVTNMVGENTFYEAADERDTRFRDLVEQVTLSDPGWVARFVPYLRGTMNMRSASVVLAAESAKVRLENRIDTQPSIRTLVAAACQRPDEPGEFLAYWRHRFGKSVPSGIQRGLSDAVARLYTERAALRYDGKDRPWRMGDVIDVVHPSPSADWQSDLYKYLLDRRHHPEDTTIPESLSLIRAHETLLTLPVAERFDPQRLQAAGVSWEIASGWGKLDATSWEALIPSMGYTALLRNLRNFDKAEVSDAVAAELCGRLADPDQVARSRQFPMRFLSAYRAAPSLRWAWALEQAVQLSLANVPSLPGRTLVMVDVSGSMAGQLSARSDLNRADAAGIFGSAVALRAENADLFRYNNTAQRVALERGASLLPMLPAFRPNGGTQTAACLQACYAKHDRVILITDEQHWQADPATVIPAHVPLYTFSLAGYRAGGVAGIPNRHLFGGLTDAAFQMLPLLEQDESQPWPF